MVVVGPPSDQDEITEESGRASLWLVTVFLLLLCALISCREAKYVIWGRTIDAEVVRVRKFPAQARDNEIQMADVHYLWFDVDDGERRDAIRKRAEDAPAVGDRIDIDYLPGVKDSREAGDRNFLAIGGLVVISTSTVGWFVILWRRTMKKRKPRRIDSGF